MQQKIISHPSVREKFLDTVLEEEQPSLAPKEHLKRKQIGP